MEEYFSQMSEQYTTAYQALALSQQLQVNILVLILLTRGLIKSMILYYITAAY